MLDLADLDKLAQARLEDARVLAAAGRWDGAMYVCGYAAEIALKARICRVLNWTRFPATQKEFAGMGSFRTHDLDILLRLSGQEDRIKQNHFPTWNAVAVWSSESRYQIIGTVSETNASEMIAAVDELLKVL
jgi:hypothetical protein